MEEGIQMRIRALSQRILKQLSHDKRTLGLMLIVPLILLTLIYFIFDGAVSDVNIGVVSEVNETFKEKLEENDIYLIEFDTIEEANDSIREGDIAAILSTNDDEINVLIDGTNAGLAKKVKSIFEMATVKVVETLPIEVNIEYLDDIEEITLFDEFGSTLIGFVIFFFVFLVAGMAFLKERKSGTIEKLISTPIKRWEIVLGYIVGFGIITIIQSVIISLYVIKVLGIMMVGSIWYLLLITLLTAICALSLGMFLSTAANSEFQMMQFVPIVIIPQLFFSGLFNLSEGWMIFGKIFPLTYIADAMNTIMFRGGGIADIYFDILILVGFSLVFAILNVLMLKRYRRI